MSKNVKVLVVDDSALIRAVLTEIINSHPKMNVVAAAEDAYVARELIKQHNPDVITLDVEMPKMNGVTFLKNIMRLRPMPVVMISTKTQEGAATTIEALEIGAVDFIAKPQSSGNGGLEIYREEIIEKVYGAATARVTNLESSANDDVQAQRKSNIQTASNYNLKSGYIIAIGASTGGTEAIKHIVSALPENSPPIVIVQHIPEAFSKSFAARVDTLSAMKVWEAEHNQEILPGNVYISPGHSHMKIALSGRGYVCRLQDGEPINRHKPAVEVLFDSAVKALNNKCMGILLTGMGADGAQALLRMKQAGCLTVAQDEESSVVWGMPGKAVELGAADKVLPLNHISKAILAAAKK